MRPTHIPIPVTKFVRTTLGCNCPEEVFESILESHVLPPCLPKETPGIKLLIGHRLLIYVIMLTDSNDTDTITGLLQHGRQERDKNGYNRIRVVVGHKTADALNAFNPQAILDKLTDIDDRMHLHGVEQNQISWLLSAPD